MERRQERRIHLEPRRSDKCKSWYIAAGTAAVEPVDTVASRLVRTFREAPARKLDEALACNQTWAPVGTGSSPLGVELWYTLGEPPANTAHVAPGYISPQEPVGTLVGRLGCTLGEEHRSSFPLGFGCNFAPLFGLARSCTLGGEHTDSLP